MVGTELPPRAASICRVRDGELLGGAVYYNLFGQVSISVHVAGKHPHWLSRDMLYVLFDYPFVQLGVERLFGMVADDNPHAIQFNMGLGFRIVAEIDGMFKNNAACLVMRLDREDCRFLNIKPRSLYRKGLN